MVVSGKKEGTERPLRQKETNAGRIHKPSTGGRSAVSFKLNVSNVSYIRFTI